MSSNCAPIFEAVNWKKLILLTTIQKSKGYKWKKTQVNLKCGCKYLQHESNNQRMHIHKFTQIMTQTSK